MPSAVNQRSSPRTLTTTDKTSMTARLVARNRKIRFMCFLLLCRALDRGWRGWFQEGPRALLGNDIRGSIGIARRYTREYGGIDHPQPLNAMHAQLVIDDGEGIVAHFAGPHRVENRRSQLTRCALQRNIVFYRSTRPVFLGPVLGEGLRRHDPPGETHAGDGHLAVFVGR